MLLRPPGVYRAQSDTEVLVDAMTRGGYAVGRHVLDLGTGAGAIALAAARAGAASVTAVDLSLRSVLATRLNCLRQRARRRLARSEVAKLDVRRGDLFGPVHGRRFDLLVANPPYVPAESDVLPRHRRARCWDAGVDGRALLDRICAGAADAVAPGGHVLVVHSALCGAQRTVDALAAAGFSADVLSRASIPFGPVMRSRAALLEARGLIAPGERVEELVVVGGPRLEDAA
jgi:release factor glutamine methyltransferase